MTREKSVGNRWRKLLLLSGSVLALQSVSGCGDSYTQMKQDFGWEDRTLPQGATVTFNNLHRPPLNATDKDVHEGIVHAPGENAAAMNEAMSLPPDTSLPSAPPPPMPGSSFPSSQPIPAANISSTATPGPLLPAAPPPPAGGSVATASPNPAISTPPPIASASQRSGQHSSVTPNAQQPWSPAASRGPIGAAPLNPPVYNAPRSSFLGTGMTAPHTLPVNPAPVNTPPVNPVSVNPVSVNPVPVAPAPASVPPAPPTMPPASPLVTPAQSSLPPGLPPAPVEDTGPASPAVLIPPPPADDIPSGPTLLTPPAAPATSQPGAMLAPTLLSPSAISK